MAVTIIDSAISAHTSHISGTTPAALSINASTGDRLVLVIIPTADADFLITGVDIRNSITFNGVSVPYSTITHRDTTGTLLSAVAYCYIKDVNMPSSAGSYNVDYTGDFDNYTGIIVLSLEGVDQTTPIKDSGSTDITTSGNDYDVAGLTAITGDISIITGAGGSISSQFTFAASYPTQTEICNSFDIGSNAAYGASYKDGATSVGSTWIGTPSSQIISAVVIGQDSGTAIGPLSQRHLYNLLNG